MVKMLRNKGKDLSSVLGGAKLALSRAMVVLLFLLSALSGCASWVMVGGPFQMDAHGYEVNLPAGWRRATAQPPKPLHASSQDITVSDSLLLTRDGVLLQYIRIERVGVDDNLKHTKKKFAERMLPQDVAEVELDEVRSDQMVRNFQLLENVPSQVAGLPGFKLTYVFEAENGLRLKRVHYGVLVRNWVYRVQYQAAARYYFDKDLATFERVRESFRITEKP